MPDYLLGVILWIGTVYIGYKTQTIPKAILGVAVWVFFIAIVKLNGIVNVAYYIILAVVLSGIAIVFVTIALACIMAFIVEPFGLFGTKPEDATSYDIYGDGGDGGC